MITIYFRNTRYNNSRDLDTLLRRLSVSKVLLLTFICAWEGINQEHLRWVHFHSEFDNFSVWLDAMNRHLYLDKPPKRNVNNIFSIYLQTFWTAINFKTHYLIIICTKNVHYIVIIYISSETLIISNWIRFAVEISIRFPVEISRR